MKTKTIIQTILFLMAFSSLQMANAQQTVFEHALHNLRYTRESRDDAQERKQQIEQHLTELIQEGDQNTINLDHLIFQMMKWIK